MSPSPYEVSKERGKKKKEGRKPLLDTPSRLTNRTSEKLFRMIVGLMTVWDKNFGSRC